MVEMQLKALSNNAAAVGASAGATELLLHFMSRLICQESDDVASGGLCGENSLARGPQLCLSHQLSASGSDAKQKSLLFCCGPFGTAVTKDFFFA